MLLFIVGAVYAQKTELDSFVGKDLWKRQLRRGDERQLDRIVGTVPKGFFYEPLPWHVWRINGSSRARYAVLLIESELTVPGGSSACIQLFDAASKRIESWSFHTGWRTTPVSASIEYSKGLKSDLIVLYMTPFVGGRVAKEYFAVDDDKLKFIRMEDDKGKVVQNEYVYPNMEIGIVPESKSTDEWVSMLESKSKADMLSALEFLGGRHFTEPERHFVSEPQTSEYADLFRQLLGNPRIHELIERLTHSEDEWVRQAALLASRGPRDRLLQ